MRFELDDLDWVIGEIAEAFGEGMKCKQMLFQYDPQLCKEALQFFEEWRQARRAAHMETQEDRNRYTPPPYTGVPKKVWRQGAVHWTR